MASSDEAFAYLEECVAGEHGPAIFLAAHKHAADRGYGRAPTDAEDAAGPGIIVKLLPPLHKRDE